jgi:hypothetical protein
VAPTWRTQRQQRAPRLYQAVLHVPNVVVTGGPAPNDTKQKLQPFVAQKLQLFTFFLATPTTTAALFSVSLTRSRGRSVQKVALRTRQCRAKVAQGRDWVRNVRAHTQAQ